MPDLDRTARRSHQRSPVAAAHLSRPHRVPLALAAGLVLLDAVFELARPWPLQMLVDNVLGERPFPSWAAGLDGRPTWLLAALAGAVVVALAALSAVVGAWSVVLVGRVGEAIGAGLRHGVVGRLLDLSPAYFRRHRSAELVNRLTSDVRRVEDAVVSWWEIALPETVVLVGTVVMLAVIDPVMALTAIAVCPLLSIVIVVRRRAIRRAQAVAREHEGEVSARAQDLVRNVRVVQAFGGERELVAGFDRYNQRLRRANARALTVEARLAPLADVVLAAGSAGVLVLGALRVQQGAMSTGTLLVAVSYVAGLFAPLRALTSLAGTLARAEASRDRLRDVYDSTPSPRSRGLRTHDLGGDVVLDSVGFGYDDRPVLQDVSLRFQAGRVTALTGPTGAGKSTVLSLLLRFETAASGRITVGGRDLRALRADDVRRQIAYVPQDSWFLDDTIRRNIELGDPTAGADDVRESADRALVSEFARRLPRGLDTVVGESGLVLSGGERKRLAIARAVVRRADLFLLDEPTAGLDEEAADLVLAALSASATGRTVVVVTHDPRVVRWADEVVHLPHAPVSSAPAGRPDAVLPSLGGR